MADLARAGQPPDSIHNVVRRETLRLVDDDDPIHETTLSGVKELPESLRSHRFRREQTPTPASEET
jgi:hypothetical protein